MLIATTILAAPNGILSKTLCTQLDPLVITTTRYFLVSIVLLPVLVGYIKRHSKVFKKKLKWLLPLGALNALGAPAYTIAISMTNVSFVAIMDLLTPILFVIISTLVTKDKLTRSAFAGVLFAVLGGSIILVLPTIFNWPTATGFGLVPVMLVLVYMITDAEMPVALRKLDTRELPLMPILAVFFGETFIIAAGLTLVLHGTTPFASLMTLPLWGWAILLFQAIGLSVAFRWLNTKSYEHLGTATAASVNYLYYALAIGLPLLLLGENLPLEVVIGGIFIVIGIYFVRHRTQLHRRYTQRHV